MKNIYLTLLLLFGLTALFQSQVIAQESPRNPLTLSGGLNVNTIFSSGLNNANKPFNYFLSGNFNLQLFDQLNIPININFSDRKINLSQGYSFNQFSISPTIQWATFHLGTNYMNFSPYTLNGHQFLGVGVELNPGNWDIQLMSGRLLKGQFSDTTNTTGPTFNRYANGAKVSYNPGKFNVGFSVLDSKDRSSSIPESNRIFNGQVLNPEDNLIVSLTFGAILLDRLQFNAELSNSLVTKDNNQLYEPLKIDGLSGLFKKGNVSSESNNAFNLNLAYNLNSNGGIIGFAFEQIDPNYKTHGAYYFLEDLRKYTLNYSQNFWDNKLNLNSNIGVQQDDIYKNKASSGSRFIGSLNMNAQPDESLHLGLNFSNFQSFMFVNDIYSQITRIPGQPIDSLDFSMISQNIGLSVNKTLNQSETRSNGITFQMNYLISNNRRDGVALEAQKSNILNGTLGYSMNFIEKGTALNIGMNMLNNTIAENKLKGFGPVIMVQKELLDKKLTGGLNFSWLRTNLSSPEISKQNSSVSNIQLISNYRPKEKHNFSLNAGLVKSENPQAFLNGTLGYSYSF
jgi:hypothetical protein